MRLGVDKCTIVMLAVNFDEKPTGLAHQRNGCRLVVDEDAGAAVAVLDTAKHDIAVIVEPVVADHLAHGMIGAHIEGGRDLPLVGAMADKRTVAPPAKGERERIEQDGFARAGFAGEHGKAGIELKVEPFNQNDIADRQLDEH